MARQLAASGARPRERTGNDETTSGGRRRVPAGGARPRKPAGNADDRRLGAGLFAIGAGYLAAAFLISEPEGGYATVGPRVFPIGIGSALVAVALWMTFRAAGNGGTPAARAGASAPGPATARPAASAPGPATARPAASAPGPATAFADWRAAAPSALLFLAYVVLLEPLGYLPATTAFIALEARLLGSRRWVRDLLAALVVTVSVHALFNLLLGLRLPAGLFG